MSGGYSLDTALLMNPLAQAIVTQDRDGRRYVHADTMNVSLEVLDGIYGQTVSGMVVRVGRAAAGAWVWLTDEKTDDAGAIPRLSASALESGLYQLELDLDGYFSALGIKPLCSAIAVKFRVDHSQQSTSFTVVVTPAMCAVLSAKAARWPAETLSR